jgi:o-succinylbenzoate---CoA ligase
VEGEILSRGLHVTPGYWNDLAATQRACHGSGWLRTGDVGFFDASGALFLSGRMKDMIKSGGENVHASEVEAVLAQLDGVVGAAVVRVPHKRLGECVAALLHVREAVFLETSGRSGDCALQHQPWWACSTPQNGCAVRNADANSMTCPDTACPAASKVPGQHGDALQLAPCALASLQFECRKLGLSAFKVPRCVAVSMLQLPRSTMGKLQKDDVLRMLLPTMRCSKL